MIHAQTVRDDQLDRMAKLGMIPSFFSSHVFFWGDWHRDSVLGPVRGARISPARSALDQRVQALCLALWPTVRAASSQQ